MQCRVRFVEQLTLNQRVPGSSPCAPTNYFNGYTATAAGPKKRCVRTVSVFTLSVEVLIRAVSTAHNRLVGGSSCPGPTTYSHVA